uniref:Uncharacterized protein n=1 Tax=Aegilops tauschii subsp. strangulata TaxID=200361 RepID=A0A452ZD09_AEGTS
MFVVSIMDFYMDILNLPVHEIQIGWYNCSDQSRVVALQKQIFSCMNVSV